MTTALPSPNVVTESNGIAARDAKSDFEAKYGGEILLTGPYYMKVDTGNKDDQSISEHGHVVFQLDPATCASNGKQTFCNTAAEVVPFDIENIHSDVTTMKWTFFAYKPTDNGWFDYFSPINTIKCDITVSPIVKDDSGTLEIHTAKPFIKEIDPLRLFKLICEGGEGDVENDST
ncbi:uncharacterized protein L201_000665 [Kwoniella dendrophila CBS 6074]|uniref:Uncharacterized protein n=1 Tax=Kwoniella dendrophila CBS 6074 TaxID=1295534 RepID=A0AAX4JN11_9TREE